MKRKEANALEEQLLKQKMDELHKKLHQVVEMSQGNLPSSRGTSEVCGLLPVASHARCSAFCFCSSLPCFICRVNSDVSLVLAFRIIPPLPQPRTGGKDNDTPPARMAVTFKEAGARVTRGFSVPAQKDTHSAG